MSLQLQNRALLIVGQLTRNSRTIRTRMVAKLDTALAMTSSNTLKRFSVVLGLYIRLKNNRYSYTLLSCTPPCVCERERTGEIYRVRCAHARATRSG